MTPAEELFNRTFARTLKTWSTIASFRQAVQRGMAAAMEETKRQAGILYGKLLSGREFEKVIIDKEKFQAAMPREKFVETNADLSRNTTINSLDAATIVSCTRWLIAQRLTTVALRPCTRLRTGNLTS